MPFARSGLAAVLFLAGCGLVAPPAQQATDQVPPAAPKAPPPSPKTVENSPPRAPPSPKPAVPVKSPVAVAPTTSPAPVAAARPPAPPPLDLKSLEQRLRDTNAIGVLTKLSLKNQVDDLIAHFRAFHQGQRPPTLAELRPAFELLLMKVLSLLQDHDTALANQINASRDAIWGVLTDRDKLAQFL